MPLEPISKLDGHAIIRVTIGYLAIDNDDKKGVISVIDRTFDYPMILPVATTGNAGGGGFGIESEPGIRPRDEWG